jgi:hypothetical protein
VSDRPDREIAARAIYSRRPFRTAMSGAVMDGFLSMSREFDFDDAPAFYRDECYELADAVLSALAFAGLRQQRPLPRPRRAA